MNNDQENLKPYLNNSLLMRSAEWLHDHLFQPISDLVERLDAYSTKKMIEKNLSED